MKRPGPGRLEMPVNLLSQLKPVERKRSSPFSVQGGPRFMAEKPPDLPATDSVGQDAGRPGASAKPVKWVDNAAPPCPAEPSVPKKRQASNSQSPKPNAGQDDKDFSPYKERPRGGADKERRREQNRHAQHKLRQRKATYLLDLEVRCETQEAEIQRLTAANEALKDANAQLTQRLTDAERALEKAGSTAGAALSTNAAAKSSKTSGSRGSSDTGSMSGLMDVLQVAPPIGQEDSGRHGPNLPPEMSFGHAGKPTSDLISSMWYD